MKIFLDDTRPTPEGWIGCRWPAEVIEYLKTGKVTQLSLDWDLGENFSAVSPRTGVDVLDWLAGQVANEGFVPPEIHIHTGSKVEGRKMRQQANAIRRAHQGRTPTRAR